MNRNASAPRLNDPVTTGDFSTGDISACLAWLRGDNAARCSRSHALDPLRQESRADPHDSRTIGLHALPECGPCIDSQRRAPGAVPAHVNKADHLHRTRAANAATLRLPRLSSSCRHAAQITPALRAIKPHHAITPPLRYSIVPPKPSRSASRRISNSAGISRRGMRGLLLALAEL
jgi:hypothetical protein